MENARSSGQEEVWYQILDKFGGVVAGLATAS